jgi:NADPH-dependent 2,4-dienoyl-CoA reductase/sulfur reductase-like enzyme
MSIDGDVPGLVVVGGSDAGIMAGLWAKLTNAELPVTVVVRDAYPNFSICGLPFYLSGETPEWQMLAHRTVSQLEDAGLRLLLGHEAFAIDPSARTVHLRDPEGDCHDLAYDRLVVGTGARSIVPPLPGVGLPGVHVLHTIDQARELDLAIERGARRAVLIGAGYIGTELADALTRRGLEVVLVEMAPAVLTTFDPDLGELVGAEVRRHGVSVRTSTTVERIAADEKGLRVLGSRGLDTPADLVIVAVGVRPETDLLVSAGAATGARGAVIVDAGMLTGLDDIWAAGDCVQTHHVLLDSPSYLPLGTTAHKQGRVAGINAAGGHASFAGSCGTQAVKVFDLVAARTGLRGGEAAAAGYQPVSVTVTADDHKAFYPGATPVHVRLTGDRTTRRLLGVQLIGAYGAEISKRIDIAATAIHAGHTVDVLSDLDLSYTPPLSSPWDPIQVAGQAWTGSVT